MRTKVKKKKIFTKNNNQIKRGAIGLLSAVLSLAIRSNTGVDLFQTF